MDREKATPIILSVASLISLAAWILSRPLRNLLPAHHRDYKALGVLFRGLLSAPDAASWKTVAVLSELHFFASIVFAALAADQTFYVFVAIWGLSKDLRFLSPLRMLSFVFCNC